MTMQPHPLSFIESLERREMLSAEGILWGNSTNLRLSFVPDGTDVAGLPSVLFSTFDKLGATSDWQRAIRQAFATWTQHVNADVGITTDSGDPLGVAGRTRGDDRFGEIRIAARPIDGVFALSVPQDAVSGTWVGDLVFNSKANIHDLTDLMRVTLHEVGNILHLKDQHDDPTSPMFSGGAIPLVSEPNAKDIAALEAIFGERSDDLNEGDHRNENTDRATRLVFIHDSEAELPTNGETPSIVHGDIRDHGDVDYYRFDSIPDYQGKVTFEVRSRGVSQLRPKISIVDRDDNVLVTTASGADVGGESLRLSLDVDGDERYYVRVESGSADLFGTGRYSLITTFDGRIKTPVETIDRLSGSSMWHLDQEDTLRFLDPSEDGSPLLNDDMHLNDTQANATILDLRSGVAGARYDVGGSLSSPTDVDVYRLRSPQRQDGAPGLMTIGIHAAEPIPLVGRVTATYEDGTPVDGTILVNADGEFVIEFSNVGSNQDMFLSLNPLSGDLFRAGNYELTATFNQQAIKPAAPLFTGTQGGSVKFLTYHVAEPQFAHFFIQTTATAGTTSALKMTLSTPGGKLVRELIIPANEVRSIPATLLGVGDYRIATQLTTVDGVNLEYSIWVVTLSSPLAVVPDNPIDDPFVDCPGLDPDLCIPGDANSSMDVTFEDMLIVSVNFGTSGSDIAWPQGDFDGDRTVQFSDFLILAAHFGESVLNFPRATPPLAEHDVLLVDPMQFVTVSPRKKIFVTP